MTMTEIGKYFGVTSHQVGRWLKQIGLRTDDGKPSQEAFSEGYVAKADNDRCPGTYYYAWHVDKTIAALEKAGHKRLGCEIETPALIGPFTSRQSGECGHEIVNAEGKVPIWINGKENAERVVWLLNVAHQYGKLS